MKKLAPEMRGRWTKDDELRNVDLVWLAQKPRGKQVVVGWYKNATVFHKIYHRRPNPRKETTNWRKGEYLCEVDAENAILLSEDKRTFEIPYAPVHGAGYPGHSNVWYASKATGKGAKLVDQVRRYIGSGIGRAKPASRTSQPGKRLGWAVLDKKTTLAIENASMEAVVKHFEAAGYTVERVHRDYCGRDLTAQKGTSLLQLEVKGHRGDVIQFELTPNEYEKMQSLHKTYRVCVVRRALEDETDVEVYAPKRLSNDIWELRDEQGRRIISLGERTGVRASQVK